MTLRFVSTTILESDNGIDFSKEKPVDISNSINTKDPISKSCGKTLYQQLQERNIEKQNEYDAMTKLIYAPPKALDEDDVQYFQELKNKQKNQKEIQKQQENELLQNFRKKQSKQLELKEDADADGHGNSKIDLLIGKDLKRDNEEVLSSPIAISKYMLTNIIESLSYFNK